MKCPYCNLECADDANFCVHCGKELNKAKICKKCGNEINQDDHFCTNCGSKIDNNTNNEVITSAKENDIKTIIGIVVALLITISFIIWLIFSATGNTEIEYKKAPNCENDTVKNLVIGIFKEHNYYYPYINPNSVSSIELIYPASKSYDETIDKYVCSGTVVMHSTYGGFTPLSEHNPYYRLIYHFKYLPQDYITYLTQYTTYSCNVEYSSQISEGNVLVSSTSCQEKSSLFEEHQGKFYCDGECGKKDITEKQPTKIPDNSSKSNKKVVQNTNQETHQWDDYSSIPSYETEEDQRLKQEAENDLF